MRKIDTRIRKRLPIQTVTVRGKPTRLPDMRPFVAKGARLLDERVPDWYRNVLLGNLRMANATQCVVGQLAIKAMLNGPLDGYHEGVDRLFGEITHDYQRAIVAAEHGFALPQSFLNSEEYNSGGLHLAANWRESVWEQLNHLWVEEIRERRRTKA